jgi:hypothetical protein
MRAAWAKVWSAFFMVGNIVGLYFNFNPTSTFMKYLLTTLFAFCLYSAHSQTVERWEYLQISVPVGGFNSKTAAMYDDGERVIKWKDKNDGLKDSTGMIEFKSPVHALNYLGDQGWECFDHSQQNPLGTNLEVFYFKRRKK